MTKLVGFGPFWRFSTISLDFDARTVEGSVDMPEAMGGA